MNKVKKILNGFGYFGTFVIVFIIILFVIMMLWPGGSEEDDDSSKEYNIKKQVITNREQAREEMEKYLLKKYGKSYEVSLPSRTEVGEFYAYFYNPYENIVEINVETGKCRDSGIKSIVEDYLKEKLEPIINNSWNENMHELANYFFYDVPSKDWPVDSNPLDIIEVEYMQFVTVIVVNTESIDKNFEANKVKQFLDLDELYKFKISLEIYYVNNEQYQQIVDTYQNSTYIDGKLLLSIGDNYYNKLVVRHIPRKGEITTDEIMEDFTN